MLKSRRKVVIMRNNEWEDVYVVIYVVSNIIKETNLHNS